MFTLATAVRLGLPRPAGCSHDQHIRSRTCPAGQRAARPSCGQGWPGGWCRSAGQRAPPRAPRGREAGGDAQASLDFLTPSWGEEGIFDRIRQLAEQADQFAALHASILRAIEVRPEATLADFRDWLDQQRSGTAGA
jgi:hypothetical protein